MNWYTAFHFKLMDGPGAQSGALLREIHARGHEMGIHHVYHTYLHPEALARSVAPCACASAR